MFKKTLWMGTTALLAAAIAVPAMAQTDEIIITATKREQTLQETPVAVSVTGAETIEKASVLDLSDLQTLVPSLRVTQLQSSANTNFVIRGFGNGANNPGIEPSVALFIDGVYRSRSGAAIADLPALERVEVLRGPQSTLFGKNASAGVISIVTPKPQFEFAGLVEGTLGNYGQRSIKGGVTGPLSDTIAFSASGSYNKNDGYFTNLANGQDYNGRDRWSLRGQLLFEPSDNMSWRLIADHSEIDEVCCGAVNLLDGPTGAAVRGVGGDIFAEMPFERQAFYDVEAVNELEQQGVSLQGDIDFDGFQLTSISSFRDQSLFTDYDADFTSASLIGTNANTTEIDTFTQELRLTSTAGERIDWQLGGFYFNEDIGFEQTLLYGNQIRGYADFLAGDPATLAGIEQLFLQAPGTFQQAGTGRTDIATQDNTAYSVFGTVDFHPTDRLTLTAGLNYTNDEKEITLRQNNTDVYSQINLNTDLTAFGVPLPTVLFGQAFTANTTAFAPGGLAPTPQNIAFVESLAPGTTAALNAGVAQGILDLQALQFIPQLVAIPNSVEDGLSEDSETTFTLRASFEVNDNVNVYASYATGFKATSWNLSNDSRPFPADRAALGTANLLPGNFVNVQNPLDTRFAEPEKAKVFEVGLKARFDRGAINVAIFDQTIEGFQSNIFNGTGFNLANAGEQSTKGVEIDGTWTPVDPLTLTFAGTFLDPVYDSFVNGLGVNGPADLSGQKPAGIHNVSISTSATYNHEFDNGMTGFLRGDFLYEDAIAVVDNIPASLAGREVQVFNASAGVSFAQGFDVMVWGRNLTDDEFLLSAFPSVAQAGSVSGYPNAPRTYGITLRKHF